MATRLTELGELALQIEDLKDRLWIEAQIRKAEGAGEAPAGSAAAEAKAALGPGPRTFPSGLLNRSPKLNWVERAGGLPEYIERIAAHLHFEGGKSIGTAGATAVNVVKKMCATGDLNFPGKQNVNPGSRAAACAAVAQWEALKARA